MSVKRVVFTSLEWINIKGYSVVYMHTIETKTHWSPWTEVTAHLLELKVFQIEWKLALIAYLPIVWRCESTREQKRRQSGGKWEKQKFLVSLEISLSGLSHTQLVLVVTANICSITQETDSGQHAPKLLNESKQAQASLHWLPLTQKTLSLGDNC